MNCSDTHLHFLQRDTSALHHYNLSRITVIVTDRLVNRLVSLNHGILKTARVIGIKTRSIRGSQRELDFGLGGTSIAGGSGQEREPNWFGFIPGGVVLSAEAPRGGLDRLLALNWAGGVVGGASVQVGEKGQHVTLSEHIRRESL